MSNGNGPKATHDPDLLDFGPLLDMGPPFDGYPPGILTAVTITATAREFGLGRQQVKDPLRVQR